jgi:hypothetical protein
LLQSDYAPVAQLDRVFASEAKGRAFESRRAHHFFTNKIRDLRAHARSIGRQTRLTRGHSPVTPRTHVAHRPRSSANASECSFYCGFLHPLSPRHHDQDIFFSGWPALQSLSRQRPYIDLVFQRCKTIPAFRYGFILCRRFKFYGLAVLVFRDHRKWTN